MTAAGPDREERRLKPEVALVVLGGAIAGPLAALLHETDMLSLGPVGTLWPLGFVATASVAGIAAAALVARRAGWLLGVLMALPNAVVLLFYGFLLLFFGLGGSR